MAPRTAKTKKAADVKVGENDAPKKGRGKGKNTEDVEQEVPEIAIDEKPSAAAEKKTKRGKKVPEANGDAQMNGSNEEREAVPPAKRGRKKKELEEPLSEERSANGDYSAEEERPAAEEEENGHHTESNGTEEAQSVATGRGRKKAVKKEEKPKETAKGKRKQASPENEEKEEKPKGKSRGRKAKADAAPDPEGEEKTESVEETKSEPATKGRKKAPVKVVKEKTPEIEKESADESEKSEPQEEKTEDVKKETKGKKGKKTQAKEEGQESEEKEPASKKRKVTKKEEKGKGDAKDEEASEDGQDLESQEAKPAKGKRGKKADALTVAETEEEPQEPDSAAKRRRKPAEEKAPPVNKKTAKNKAVTNYEELDFSNNSKSTQGKEWNFKISSWNVDGIRAWMGKGGLDYLKFEKPDILCLQETKCAQDKMPDELTNVPGYHAYWLCSDKDGYAGVGIYTTQLAMNVQYGLQNKELDDEGRIITAEYEQFYLICTYVPNAGRKLVTLPKRLQWNDEFRKYVKELNEKKPVIICGDMNVAHNEIDLANPKSNRKNAGFTEEERAGMTELLGDGFVDTFRHLYPDKTAAYTFWTYMMNARAKNVGWRLDYFLVSERLVPSVCDNVIRDQVFGSDHCPISLFLHLTSADKPKEE